MSVLERHESWTVWPLWVAACAVGNAVSAMAFSSAAGRPVAFALAFVLVLTLPALLQWLILRQWFRGAGWWIVASGVGWALGYLVFSWGIAVADTQAETTFARVVVPVAFGLPGAVAGAVQWLALRRWVARAAWWVLASAIGWMGGLWLFMLLAGTGQGRYFEGGLVSQAVAGAVSGAFSGAVNGLALVWLMREIRDTYGRLAPR